MNKIAIAIHGGAGEDSAFIRTHQQEYKQGLKEAIEAGYAILKSNGSALDAVTAAVRRLEDNELFNAGRGSALNHAGEVEMDAAVMNGENLKAGAVAMVRLVRNPVELARAVMEKTNHVLIGGYGALNFARSTGIAISEETYFITQHQLEELKNAQHESESDLLKKPVKGTVGAVALDSYGNVAAATSTGGTPNSLPARIGDSCIIGAGCYADNNTCAVSGTGDGELLMRGVTAHSIAMMMEPGTYSIQEASDYVVKKKNMLDGDLGVIAITPDGGLGISFNSERMHRAWINVSGELSVMIYP